MTIKAKDLKPSGASVDYQWQRAEGEDGQTGEFVDIEDETNETYTLTEDDQGNWIRLKVTGKGSSYRGTVYSEPVGPIVDDVKATILASIITI